MGQLYQRGRIYWVKYYVAGRPVRESTGTDKEAEARRVLKTREGRSAAGLPVLPRADKVRYEEIAKDLRQHYESSGARDVEEAEFRLAHLDRAFTGRRVAAIGGAEVTTYVVQRQKEGAANGTINREVATLSRMFRLAYENQKLLRLPVIRRLKEAAPRAGFFEREAFEDVRRHLPADLQVAVTVAYAFGWRMQSEVLALERRHLDLAAGTLSLDATMTKNDEGRVVYLPGEVKAALAAQVGRVDVLQRQVGRVIPHLFPHLRGRHRGEQRGDFRKAWASACRKAGVPGMLKHDLRRTAVRNMVNKGIPERVAMTVTGHKTRSVFDRYHIVSPADLQDVARRLTGTISGTLGS